MLRSDYWIVGVWNIWHKLWFLHEIAHYWRSRISIFQQSFASVGGVFILGVGLGAGLWLNAMRPWEFPNIS